MSNACRFLHSSDMKIAVQKNHLEGQILYRSVDPKNDVFRIYEAFPKFLYENHRKSIK